MCICESGLDLQPVSFDGNPDSFGTYLAQTHTGASGGVGGELKIATQLVHPEKVIDDPYMASNTPIYQTATFGQPTATTFGPYDYTRSGNPTRTVLEKQMAALEGAHGARAVCHVCVSVCVPRGMALLSRGRSNAHIKIIKDTRPKTQPVSPRSTRITPFNIDVPALPHGSTSSGLTGRGLDWAACAWGDRTTHTGAYAFASGMGALAAVTRLVSSGERIVTGDDIYGGTSRLLAEIVPRQGIEVVNVDCCDLAAVKAAITPNTKLVWCASITVASRRVSHVRRHKCFGCEFGLRDPADPACQRDPRGVRAFIASLRSSLYERTGVCADASATIRR